jgi:hypothetical protein
VNGEITEDTLNLDIKMYRLRITSNMYIIAVDDRVDPSS